MSSPFSVTTATNAVHLDAGRRGEVAFTVSNICGAPLRGRSRLVPEHAVAEQWLKLSDGAERNFPNAGAEQYIVKIAVPTDAPAGSYQFHLDMVDVAKPDENYVKGPTVTFDVPAPAPIDKPFPWWIVALAAVVLLIGGGIAAIVFWPRETPVPDGLVGMPYTDAAAELEQAGLTAARVDDWNAATEGEVFRTAPAAGARVKPGATVTLYVSRGAQPPQEVVLLDFKGWSEASARDWLERACEPRPCLRVQVQPQADPALAAGQVISSEPAKDSRVPPGSTVMLYVSSGIAALAAPQHLAPADGAVFDFYPRTTTLEWRAVPGAASYTVEIDCFHCCETNSWCSDVGRTFRAEASISATTYTFDFVGAQPGRWRVSAVGADGQEGPKSGWWEFRYTK